MRDDGADRVVIERAQIERFPVAAVTTVRKERVIETLDRAIRHHGTQIRQGHAETAQRSDQRLPFVGRPIVDGGEGNATKVDPSTKWPFLPCRSPQTRCTSRSSPCPRCATSTLFGMVDLFASAGRDWSFLLTGVEGEQRMSPYIVAAQRDGFAAANGVWVRPHYGLGDGPKPDIVCVPDFSGCRASRSTTASRPRWPGCAAATPGGATMASACSGAVLLAEAGLLAGCDATIHWAYVAALARYPDVRVRTNRSLVVTGEGGRIVMAGGGTSWQDMALYLIARYVGLKEARQVARIYMLDWHDDGQLPFASLLVAKQIDDALIARCQEWAALNYATCRRSPRDDASRRAAGTVLHAAVYRGDRDVAAGVRASSAHRGSQADAGDRRRTGRGGRCRGRLPGHASFFSRLFRRRVGMTPAHYRRRFSSLRRALAK